MYISFLDYLEEVKKKFYIILITIALFFLLSFAFKSYKDNFYNINLKTSLLKLSSLSLQNINLETSANVAVNWISDDAISYFNKINKYKDLKMKCDVTSHFLDCKISGKFSKNLDEVKDNMYKSISKAFDQYENNFTNLIDGLIKSRKELFLYVVDSYSTTSFAIYFDSRTATCNSSGVRWTWTAWF